MTEIVTDTATPAPVVKLQLTEKEREALESKFTRSDTGCWLWHGATSSKEPGRDYGTIRFRGRNVSAHRVSFQIHHRLLEPGEHVLHRCDTPRCIRPSCLMAGSHTDNMWDKVRKGRANAAAGQRNSHAVLTNAQVLDIRARFKKKYGALTALAKEYGVSVSCIEAITKGKTWTHL